jgi:hypothetical protein
MFRGFGGPGVIARDCSFFMKLKLLVPTALLALIMPAAMALAAAPTETEIIARARASYPLKTCLVSDEPLGSMGDAVGYVHRAPGKPERVVFVCCEGCIDDFKADPAKFLKKVDAAAAGAKTGRARKS